MFIENLRHVKKKWKIPMLIGVILILLGLMGSYAYMGSSYGATTSGIDLDSRIDTLKSNIKALKKEVKENPEDGALLYELGQDYYSLAAYQTLLFKEDDAATAYESAIGNFEQAAQLFTGETTDEEWVELYTRWFGSYIALGDPDGACEVFQSSVEPLGYNADVLSAFASQMQSAEQEDALIEQLTALSEEVPEDETDYLSSVTSYLSSAQYSLLTRLQEELSTTDEDTTTEDTSTDE